MYHPPLPPLKYPIKRLPRMTEAQLKEARKLIRNECCNYVKGHCIALDDGIDDTCPQWYTYSLLCKWFRHVILPMNPLMEGISMKSYYNYLIKKSRATLFKLISLRGENADLKAEKLLKTCSIEVVETVSIILILGRDAYYDKQTEPAKDPVKLFKEYYDEHWIDDPEMKEYEIEYIVSKRDLPDYLQAGMKVLNIQ